MKWIIAILILGLLIAFHELGHFVLAKICGVGVEEYSIGFGPRILSAVFRGTRYSLKILPFGGSCRMKGEYGDLEDDGYGDAGSAAGKTGDAVSGDGTDGTPGEAFQNVSVGKRAAIIAAGPLFNFLLAFVFSVIVISVVGYDPPVVLRVAENSPAAEAGLEQGDTVTSFMGHRVTIGRDVDSYLELYGLKPDEQVTMSVKKADGTKASVSFTPDVITRYMMGITYEPGDKEAELLSVSRGSSIEKEGAQAGDVIVSIDGTKVASGKELSEYLDSHPVSSDPIRLVLLRNGREREIVVQPVLSKVVDEGFLVNIYRTKATPVQVLRYSLYEVRYWITMTVRSIGLLIRGTFSINDLSGPVGVVNIVGDTYEQSRSEGALMTWMNMLYLMILLSANLGVMNLLPIPAIDGGRLLFLVIEAIRGKPVNRKVEGVIQMIVMALLLLLMGYVMVHDVMKMFF